MTRITGIILRSNDEHVADQHLVVDSVWRQFTGDDKFQIHEIEQNAEKYKLSVSGRTFNDIDKIDKITFEEDGDGDPLIVVRDLDPVYAYPKRITPLLHQHAKTRHLRISWQPEKLDVIISSMFYSDVSKLKEIILVRGE